MAGPSRRGTNTPLCPPGFLSQGDVSLTMISGLVKEGRKLCFLLVGSCSDMAVESGFGRAFYWTEWLRGFLNRYC